MQRAHRTAHRRIWRGLAVLLPLILLTAFALRQYRLPDPPSLRLAPPPEGPRP
jgi:hypothetical protein